MSFKTFGLIDNDDMFILIETIYKIRFSKGNFFLRVIIFIENQLDGVSLFDNALPINSMIVDEDMLFDAEKMADFARDKEVILQQLFNSTVWVRIDNSK